jgi:putative transposase
MDWARMLAYVTGTLDQELLARNEYLIAENRIVKAQLNGRLKLSDAERSTLGEIGHRLGRTALAEVATVAKVEPEHCAVERRQQQHIEIAMCDVRSLV